jgi:hypothetical protein
MGRSRRPVPAHDNQVGICLGGKPQDLLRSGPDANGGRHPVRIEGSLETAQTRLGLPDPVLGKIAELRADVGRPRLRAGIGHDVQHGQASARAAGKTDGHRQDIARDVREVHARDDAEHARAVATASIGLSSSRRHVRSVSH